ncbi:hypothetical protein [Hymenobacter sediminicola]|uniref:Uncharacterized protein n=1 Tax=Hymenobacter sediminicola TaxID=2761579 RepID=A0A7G7W324_9BACT|nr:hypothetical protein [Hymenobacter sediminicola]QNH60767.1 hypothetical protein H4317_11250 [Hymenobacter sediminicola]
MSTHLIKKGHHQDNRPFSSWPHIGRKSIAFWVTFGQDCAYSLPDYYAANVNKLFGLSFGFFGVHRNSARFGWYWDPEQQCMRLIAYCYTDGVKDWNLRKEFPVVGRAQLGQRVLCRLVVEADAYHFSVSDASGQLVSELRLARPKHLPGFGLTHSLYFGGELPAPHDMHIEMQKA